MILLKLGDSYFCIANREYSYSNLRKNYLLRCKVHKDSFAYAYMDKIFSGLFINAINLKEEYRIFIRKNMKALLCFYIKKKFFKEIASLHLYDTDNFEYYR